MSTADLIGVGGGVHKSSHGTLVGNKASAQAWKGGSDVHYIPFVMARRQCVAMGEAMEQQKNDHVDMINALRKRYDQALVKVRQEDNQKLKAVKDGALRKIEELMRTNAQLKKDIQSINQAQEALRRQQLADVKTLLDQKETELEKSHALEVRKIQDRAASNEAEIRKELIADMEEIKKKAKQISDQLNEKMARNRALYNEDEFNKRVSEAQAASKEELALVTKQAEAKFETVMESKEKEFKEKEEKLVRDYEEKIKSLDDEKASLIAKGEQDEAARQREDEAARAHEEKEKAHAVEIAALKEEFEAKLKEQEMEIITKGQGGGIPESWIKQREDLIFQNRMLEQKLSEVKSTAPTVESMSNRRSEDDEKTINEQQDKITNLTAKLQDQMDLVATKSDLITQMHEQMRTSNDKCNTFEARCEAAEAKVGGYDAKMREKESEIDKLTESKEEAEKKYKEIESKYQNAVDEKDQAIKRMEDIQKIMDSSHEIPESVAEAQKRIRDLEVQRADLLSKVEEQEQELQNEKRKRTEEQKKLLVQRDQYKSDFLSKKKEWQDMKATLKKIEDDDEKKAMSAKIKEQEKEMMSLKNSHKEVREKLKESKKVAQAAKKQAEEKSKQAEEEKNSMEKMLQDQQDALMKAQEEGGESDKKVNMLAPMLLEEKDRSRKLDLDKKRLERKLAESAKLKVSLEEEVNRKQVKIDSLSEQLEKLDKQTIQLKATAKSVDGLKSQLQQQQEDVKRMHKQTREAQDNHHKANDEIAKLKEHLSDTEKQRDMYKADVDQCRAEAKRALAVAKACASSEGELKMLRAKLQMLESQGSGGSEFEVSEEDSSTDCDKLQARIKSLLSTLKARNEYVSELEQTVEKNPSRGSAGESLASIEETEKLRDQIAKLKAQVEGQGLSAPLMSPSEGPRVAKAVVDTEALEEAKASLGAELDAEKQKNKELEDRIEALSKDSKKAMEKHVQELGDKHKEELMEAQKKLTSLQQKESSLESELASTKSELMSTKDTLATTTSERESARKELADFKENSKAALERCAKMEAETQSLNKKIKEQEDEVQHWTETANKWQEETKNAERLVIVEASMRKKLQVELMNYKGNIRVFCRVRPFSKHEKRDKAIGCVRTGINDWTLQLNDPKTDTVSGKTKSDWKNYSFDHVFPNFPPNKGNQKAVFEETKIYAEVAMSGQSACVFAYGQSGTGKTWTMSGIVGDPENEGIKPRMFNELFAVKKMQKKAFEYEFRVQMMEIYGQKKKQQLRDLFYIHDQNKKSRKKASSKAPTKFPEYKGPELKIGLVGKKKKRVEIMNAQSREFNSAQEMIDECASVEKCRFVRATGLNDESSRSHLITIIHIKTRNLKTRKLMRGKLTLVDLAGSEKAEKTAMSADLDAKQREAMLAEGVAINTSLGMLRNLFLVLSGSDKKAKPQYRGNVLTELLQDSIGGGAKTLMFVNVGPAARNKAESMDSMRYAEYAKNVVNAIDGEDADLAAQNKELERKVVELEKKLKAG